MERIGIFVDVGNLYHATLRKYNRKVNYEKLYLLASAGLPVAHSTCYVVGAANNAKFVPCLRRAGFKNINVKQPKTFSDGTKKANQDLAIASDICRHMAELDTIVLISADGDFQPVLKLCKDKGKTIIVIGCDISFELKDIAHQYVEIKESLLETDNAAE